MPLKAKALFFSIFFLLFTNIAFAQDTLSVSYFKKDNFNAISRDSAYYLRIVKKPDSGSVFYNIAEFYTNGTPKLLGRSSKKEYLILQGKCTKFFRSGKIEEVATYNDNIPVGDIVYYYPNGTLYTIRSYPNTIENRHDEGDFSGGFLITTCNDSTGKALVINGNGYYIGYSNGYNGIAEEGNVKNGLPTGTWKGNGNIDKTKVSFEEKYEDGKLISGVAKSKDGLISTYTKRLSRPDYPGGVDEFYRFLVKNIKYPRGSKKLNIQGKVIISFVVEKDGKLTDIKVTQSVSNDLDAEAVRVINQSPKWIPGVMYGQNVRVQYAVPISFHLDD